MTIQPLVSVLIPAYNHEDYIQETVQSIIDQTYQDIEIIVYDDHSPDHTFEKLNELRKECEQRFVRVVFKTHENWGCTKNSSELIKEAHGTYFYMIASDDIAKPNAIQTLVDYMENHPNCVRAVGDNEIIDLKSQRVYWNEDRRICDEQKAVWKTFGEKLGCYTNHTDDFGTYASLLKSNHIPNGYLTRMDVAKSIFPLPDDLMLDDYYWNLQLAKQGTIDFIPQILFSYRWHNSNTITNPEFVKKRQFMMEQILNYEKEYCFNHGLKKQWKKVWKQQHPSSWKRYRRTLEQKIKNLWRNLIDFVIFV